MKVRMKSEKKIIIRHLPPTLSSEQFIEQVSPISDHNYYCYVKGDPSLGAFSYSRAYINFINQEDILHFREKFDNYVFVDEKGNEYPAIVELALYQGIPKKSKKVDVRCNTIQSDPHFIQFVENKENHTDISLPTVQECLEEIEAKEKEQKSNHVITPLLDYIKNANKKQLVTKKSSRDERRDDKKKDEKKKIDRKKEELKGKESSIESLLSAQESVNKGKSGKDGENKESVGEVVAEDLKKRYNRENEVRKPKNIDKKNDNKDTCESSKKSTSESLIKNEEIPRATFTVKILNNEKRNSDISKDEKSSESKENRLISGEKIRNKNRPSIQIYKPKPRSTIQSKDQNNLTKSNQEKSSRQS